MNRYKIEPVGASYWVIDTQREDEAEHPAASTGCWTYAARIMAALNAVHELDVGLLTVGQVYRKCGVSRAIIRVSEDYVWYESLPTFRWNSRPPIVRTFRARFEDWVHGSKIVRTDNPTRFAKAQEA